MFGIRILRRSRIGCLRLFLAVGLCFVIYLLIKDQAFLPGGDVGDVASLGYGDEENLSEENLPTALARPQPADKLGVSMVWPVPPRLETRMNPKFAKIVKITPHVETRPLPTAKDGPFDVEEARKAIKKLNEEQKILNLEKFPSRTEKSIVIVIQVHKRAKYLQKLIESLQASKGISDSLLIFSHDFISNEMDSLVRGINFSQVLQIYFPYSSQLHPNEFPGTDPNDCPRDHRIPGCNNEHHPDRYGHYREAGFTMTKHHWWWKANRVFRDLRATQNHRGLVLFLEEDHYVAPDFYDILQKAYVAKDGHKKACDIITLGDYKKLFAFQDGKSSAAEIRMWKSSEHNMGMAFDRSTWQKIEECSRMFCVYDDYNWDWSLMKMSLSCSGEPFNVLLLSQPRVFHVGTCGLHHKAGSCDVEETISNVKTIISEGTKFLYPDKLAVTIHSPWISLGMGQPNGGWGDIRDHELCMKFRHSTE